MTDAPKTIAKMATPVITDLDNPLLDLPVTVLDDAAFAVPEVEDGERGFVVVPGPSLDCDPVPVLVVVAVLEGDVDGATPDVEVNGSELAGVPSVSLSWTSTYRWSKLISLELSNWLFGRLYTLSVCCVDGSRATVKMLDSTAVSSSVTVPSVALLVCKVHASASSQSIQ